MIKRGSCMLIIQNGRMQSSYMMVLYEHCIWRSHMLTRYDHQVCISFALITKRMRAPHVISILNAVYPSYSLIRYRCKMRISFLIPAVDDVYDRHIW